MFDFYMVPHYALKGTARPSHYHVLHNDARVRRLPRPQPGSLALLCSRASPR